MKLDYFITEETNGTVFCKIGKSSDAMWGKGGHFPYREHIGNVVTMNGTDTVTFEPLEEVVKYLHYGDDLVIFNFSKAKGLLPEEGYEESLLNKGCFYTKTIYVDAVLSFEDASTVDFIFNTTRNIALFKDLSTLAASHLEDRNLYEAANRWRALAQEQ